MLQETGCKRVGEIPGTGVDWVRKTGRGEEEKRRGKKDEVNGDDDLRPTASQSQIASRTAR